MSHSGNSCTERSGDPWSSTPPSKTEPLGILSPRYKSAHSRMANFSEKCAQLAQPERMAADHKLTALKSELDEVRTSINLVEPPELRHALLQVLLRSVGRQFGGLDLGERITELEAELVQLNDELHSTTHRLKAAAAQHTAAIEAHDAAAQAGEQRQSLVEEQLRTTLRLEQERVCELQQEKVQAAAASSSQLLRLEEQLRQHLSDGQAAVSALQHELSRSQEVHAHTNKERQSDAITITQLEAKVHQLQSSVEAAEQKIDSMEDEASRQQQQHSATWCSCEYIDSVCGSAMYDKLESGLEESWKENTEWQQLCEALKQDAGDLRDTLKAEAKENELLRDGLHSALREISNQEDKANAMSTALHTAQEERSLWANEAHVAKAAIVEMRHTNDALSASAQKARDAAVETETASVRLVLKAQETARQAEKSAMVCDCNGRSVFCIANVHNTAMCNWNLHPACSSEMYLYK